MALGVIEKRIRIIIETIRKGTNPALLMKKYNENVKKGVAIHGRFHMELLGVMFAGMALQRTMMGLLQPAMQATGIFEYWSSVLTVLFLPTVLALLPAILELGSFIMDLSPAMKNIIGALVLFGATMGGLLFGIGTLGLAFFSLQIAVGGLGIAMGPLIIAAAAVAAAVAILFLAWQENWFGIREAVDRARPLIETALTLVGEAVNLFKGLVKEAIGLVLDVLGELGIEWDDVWSTMKVVLETVWGIMKPIIENITRGIQVLRENVGFITRTLMGTSPGGAFLYDALQEQKKLEQAREEARAASQTFGDRNIIESVNFSPTINVSGSNMDIEALKSQLNEEWRDEIDSMLRRT